MLSILLASSAGAQAPGDVIWSKVYGGPEFDQARDIKQTSDGGYVLAGDCAVFDTASRNPIYVVRLDPLGDTLWTRIYDHGDFCEGRSILETADGGFILAGHLRPPFIDTLTPSDGTGYVMRLNSYGDTLWTHRYGGINHEAFRSIRPTSDGGYILAGETESFVEYPTACYLVKIDSVGNQEWDHIYYDFLSFTNVASDVRQTSDGGYIVAGNVGGFGGGRIFLVRTDPIGDTLWTRFLTETENEHVYSIREHPDGGFILAGGAWDAVYSTWNFLLAKIDAFGNLEWRRVYGGPANEECYSFTVTPEGGYVLAGLSEAFGEWVTDVWLVVTDSDGDTLWTRNYGSVNNNDMANSVAVAADSNIVFAGYFNYDWSTCDLYVVKVSSRAGGGGGCAYLPGDINGNGAANGIDVVYGVNYFKGSTPPPVICGMCPQTQPFYAAGDVNGNCAFNGIDISFFVNYLKGVVPALLNCPSCPPVI